MKVGAIIQARTGSSRLPEKVMKDLDGKTVLAHVIERVRQSNRIDEIVIATTVEPEDAVIEKEAIKMGVRVFRGSEADVLSRYYYAAKENHIDVVVRITSDCPLIDPQVIDEIVSFYMANHYTIVSNGGSELSNRTYPRGLDTEVFSFESLEQAFLEAKELYQREHVTPYIYEKGKEQYYYKNKVDYSKYRWTLDTKEDWELISEIYKHLYRGKHDFYLEDIIELFDRMPELYEINAHIEQKKLK